MQQRHPSDRPIFDFQKERFVQFQAEFEPLQEWLNPEEEEEFTPADGKLEVDEVKEEPKSNYSLSTKPAAKKSKADQFDDLFDDDEDSPF